MSGHLLDDCSLIDLLLPVMQRVFETQFLGRPTIIKQRFSKQYRHPTLDAKLTTSRLKQVCKGHNPLLAPAAASPQPANPTAACRLQEVRSISRARKIGVACPVVYYVEQEAATIYMEQIHGRSVKALISEGKITEAGGAMMPCACCIAAASWLNSCRSTGVEARCLALGAYSQKQAGGSPPASCTCCHTSRCSTPRLLRLSSEKQVMRQTLAILHNSPASLLTRHGVQACWQVAALEVATSGVPLLLWSVLAWQPPHLPS